ncbi:RdgB/HAM1 family non-canonical purine NTP pyrophosphatase [Rheinheimera sp. MMS21-TC3]|uniref:RdgB/HAM1 family non-canonical purine NTP pyrophosphatase n=1 Tax=Rheinheimera sp. MMS21-TC3 TaxID=3072790 RepID=UPI0028C44A11|nr:RdgB/HAM1 family non-canonical purine NTP pyrophosphatase [Rheinheimera sp. MMS21-TC3]WNO61389.1 RdgB/HAM1 family non-canonical purine NTP pyrophosphatase [Rheinheimera sp. MMS21-TC3]
MRKIVLASSNKGKVAELSQMLAGRNIDIIAQSALGVTDAAETGLTFIENAIIKARHAALSTGLPAIADDSGLAVDALGGAPGIYSARYAGEGATDKLNIDKLLSSMQGIPVGKRSAQFHCVLVYMRHAEDPTPLICHGIWHGEIATSAIGEHGFGYDPVFWLNHENCSAAQLTPSQKQQLSHRGQALKTLLQGLD